MPTRQDSLKGFIALPGLTTLFRSSIDHVFSNIKKKNSLDGFVCIIYLSKCIPMKLKSNFFESWQLLFANNYIAGGSVKVFAQIPKDHWEQNVI